MELDRIRDRAVVARPRPEANSGRVNVD